MPTLCPCQSGQALIHCCGPILAGKHQAQNAEALMRSRYSAYTLGNIAYIRKSQSTAINADFSTPKVKKWARSVQWVSLVIHTTKQGGPNDREGWVHFTATYRDQDGLQHIEENSYFLKTDKGWQYQKPLPSE